MEVPALFAALAAMNAALVVLGYEAGTSHTVPHWVILASAFAFAIFAASLWSTILRRAYVREDRALALAQRLSLQLAAERTSTEKKR